MQTFLPYPDFAQSAASLDMMRLGKQRVETFQVLQKLVGERLVTGVKAWTGRERRISVSEPGTPENEMEWRIEYPLVKFEYDRRDWHREPILTKGWDHHPAKVMWEGHELSLLEYQRATCEEWVRRGYSDSTWEKSLILMEPHRERLLEAKADFPPPWLGLEAFHRSHRANLVRKAPEHYRSLFPDVDPEEPYYWPSRSQDGE